MPHVFVSKQTRRELLRLCKELGMSNTNQVINHLLEFRLNQDLIEALRILEFEFLTTDMNKIVAHLLVNYNKSNFQEIEQKYLTQK